MYVLLYRIALDSSSSLPVQLREDVVPSSLAYDWNGGHVFYIKFAGFQIDFSTINGDGVGSVLEMGPEKLYQLNILGEVAFNSYTRYLHVLPLAYLMFIGYLHTVICTLYMYCVECSKHCIYSLVALCTGHIFMRVVIG